MENQVEAITGAEWNVMRIVWSLGGGTTRQIIQMLQDSSDWKDSTIKTLLSRLVKKGALQTTKDGNRFIYTAVINEQEAMDQTASELFSHMCSKRTGKALISLLEKTTMTKSDLNELQRVIESKLKTAPDKIDCNCLPDGSCK
ncbi:CopY/TcrY family copper transport repressor [Fructilactobacillus vespulae]|uniref:CopY/TcrY family copper transport repressor n=1 Tax=Fructilactobacillus vespulae TaxID=1249630 RepID=UPI0039B416A6